MSTFNPKKHYENEFGNINIIDSSDISENARKGESANISFENDWLEKQFLNIKHLEAGEALQVEAPNREMVEKLVKYQPSFLNTRLWAFEENNTFYLFAFNHPDLNNVSDRNPSEFNINVSEDAPMIGGE